MNWNFFGDLLMSPEIAFGIKWHQSGGTRVPCHGMAYSWQCHMEWHGADSTRALCSRERQCSDVEPTPLPSLATASFFISFFMYVNECLILAEIVLFHDYLNPSTLHGFRLCCWKKYNCVQTTVITVRRKLLTNAVDFA